MIVKIIPIVLFVTIVVIYFASKILSAIPPKVSKKHNSKKDSYDASINVDLSKCEIRSSSSSVSQQAESYHGSPNILISLNSNYRDNYSDEAMYNSYLVFNTGEHQYISEPINKDPISLQALLFMKKTTYIYFNKNNPSDYFFDLDFLYET